MALSNKTQSISQSIMSSIQKLDILEIQRFLDQIRTFKIPESISSTDNNVPFLALRFEETN